MNKNQLYSNLIIVFLLFLIVVLLSIFYPFVAIDYMSNYDKYNTENIIQLRNNI